VKKILVTGAAGFIGSHLAEQLLERGDAVTAVDNFNSYYDPALKRENVKKTLEERHYELYETDICDYNALRIIFQNTQPDVVVHLAARAGVRPSIEDPNLYHQVNVIGSQHILDLCKEFDPSHLVFASSSSVYGGILEVPFSESMDVSRPISPYAATKRMNELQAHVYSRLYGMNISMLRLFSVYGPRQRPDMAIQKFAQLIIDGQPIPMFGDGSTARDYTYISDIIDGILRAIDTPLEYEIINLGGQQTTTLRELIDVIAKHVGKPAIIDRKPLQPGDVTITYADISRANELLGYVPKVGIDEGIRRFVESFSASSLALHF